MFNKGELVVYGQTGVCRIEGTCEKELERFNVKTYYVLKPIYQPNNVIYSPVENSKIHIRPIVTGEQAKRLIELIPTIKTKDFSCNTQNEIAQQYNSAVCSDDLKELIVLTMSIYAKKQAAKQQNKKLGTMDERYMQKAEDLLLGELAAALKIDVKNMKDYIKEQIGE